eukprot:tig00000792_g4194.t1
MSSTHMHDEGEEEEQENSSTTTDEDEEGDEDEDDAGPGGVPFDELSRQQIRSLLPFFMEQANAPPETRQFTFVPEEDLDPQESQDAFDLTGLMSLVDPSPAAKGEHSASSTDHEEQDVSNTISPDESFWSSSGSASPKSEEWVQYRLHAPMCVVYAVQLAVYRATYQLGEPIYPPEAVQIAVSATPIPRPPWDGSDGRPPARLLVSREIPVKATDALQTLLLGRSPAVGQYVCIRLIGKRQRQLEDNLFYSVLRYVCVLGGPSGGADAARGAGARLGPHACRHPPLGQLSLPLLQRAVDGFVAAHASGPAPAPARAAPEAEKGHAARDEPAP